MDNKSIEFKVGDWVYASRSASWGLRLIPVVDVSPSSIACKHPDLGIGRFPSNELEHETEQRRALVREVIDAKRRLELAQKRAFGYAATQIW